MGDAGIDVCLPCIVVCMDDFIGINNNAQVFSIDQFAVLFKHMKQVNVM